MTKDWPTISQIFPSPQGEGFPPSPKGDIKKGYPKPSSYGDSIYKLGDYGIVSKGFANRFVYIAGLRNFLAHDYQINTLPELEKFLKYGLKDLKDFIKSSEKLL